MDLREETVVKLLRIYLIEVSRYLPLDHWRTGVDQKFSATGKRRPNPMKGFSDFLVVLCGLTICVEAKRSKGGTVSPGQLEFRDRMLAAGGIYIIVRSVTELRSSLQEIVSKHLAGDFAPQYLQALQKAEESVRSRHRKYFSDAPLPTSEPATDTDNVVVFRRTRSPLKA